MTAPARVGGSSSRGRSSQSRRKADAEATTATPETTEAPTRTQRRPRTAAAEKAYARRAQREGRTGEPVQRRPRPPRPKNERGSASRASFVMLIMGLLVVGVISTLWLSTQAIADSYRLDQAKKAATELAERVEMLQQDVTSLESAATLADMARKLGMVPAGDPSRLVVGPDGKVSVIGDPKPVTAPPAGGTG
ncbi:septum formation initiator [Kibdelosporangium philippinense]|uniref:Septum formation initiator n=1 Tax=Kibdelosporangium philippinense TaxID=211113 RepID=A0ABS8ZIA3_9PSEU|nr:septum formation initiator [Kibdelosporangium philippinense]MCE7007475.1 septum formation initiator [Kibdelosporangium philippinense]